MDNTNNKTAVDNQVINLSQPVGQTNHQAPTQVQQDQKPALVAPYSPVGLAQKEQSPINSKVKSEIISASEKATRVRTEVREAGVETLTDEMPLTPDHKAVGIQHAGESTPVQTQPSGLVNIPEIREVKEGLQMSPIYSRRWLAEVRRRVLKMFGLWKEKE